MENQQFIYIYRFCIDYGLNLSETKDSGASKTNKTTLPPPAVSAAQGPSSSASARAKVCSA